MVISRKPVKQLNEPAVQRQECGVLGCIDGDNGSPVIPRQSGEKQAVVKHGNMERSRGDKPRDDNPQPAGDDCPDGDDCIERQKRPVILPGTSRENMDRTSINQGKETVDIRDNGKNTMIVKRSCGMPGQHACVDRHGIKKLEEPITAPRTSEGKPTLARGCSPYPLCLKRKEKGEEPLDNQDTPVNKPAPKRRCIPPFCTGKPTVNRRCAPPDDCIDRKEKDEESADSQDATVNKPAAKKRCNPPACSGKPILNRRCAPPDDCIERKEKDEGQTDNQDTPVYKPAPKRRCDPPLCDGEPTVNRRCPPPEINCMV